MSNRTIAIVEDDYLLSLVISKHFEKLGFESCSFSNAGEFMEFLSPNPPLHAVILDVKLKGTIDGIELSAFVPSNIPIIFCTGNSDLTKSKLANPQVKAILIKPIDLQELTRVLESI
jgi:DNA-binding NtrC family response regulator